MARRLGGGMPGAYSGVAPRLPHNMDGLDGAHQLAGDYGVAPDPGMRMGRGMRGPSGMHPRMAMAGLHHDEYEYEQEDEEEDADEGEEEEAFTAEVWDALDSLEQIRATVNAGPRWKLETFLEAMDILGEAAEVLERNECTKGMQAAEALLTTGLAHLLEEFRDALGKSSKPLSAEMLREVAQSSRADELADAAAAAAAAVAAASSGGAEGALGALRLSDPFLAPSSSSSPPLSPTSGGAHSTGLPRSQSVALATQLALQDWLSASAVPFLRRMAFKLATGGEGERAIMAYVKVRAEAMQASVRQLNILSVTSNVLEGLSWPDLEQCMKSWIQDMRAAVLVLLSGERSLVEEIWEGLEPEREVCFTELLRSSGLRELLATLLGNAHAIAARANCPERLFALLDMFTTVRELKPHLEGVAAVQGFAELAEDMESLPRQLAGAVRDTLAEFEAVLEEPPVLPEKAPVATEKKKRLSMLPLVGGSKQAADKAGAEAGDASTAAAPPEDIMPSNAGVHPVTSYVVNYSTNFLDREGPRNYGGTLEYLLAEYSLQVAPGPAGGGGGASASPAQQRAGERRESATAPDRGRPVSAPLGRRECGQGGAGGLHRSSSSGRAGQTEDSGGSGGQGANSAGGAARCVPGGPAGASGYAGAGSKCTVPELASSLLASLMRNLEARARLSPDPILGALFLLNNAAYVQRHLCDPSRNLLADVVEWTDGRCVDAYGRQFQERALAKVAASLQEATPDVRAKLKKFNASFEELAIRQASWSIVDEEWRKRTRNALAARLKEMYAKFLLPYREELCEYKSYRYTPNAIERVVLDYFFLGSITSRMPTF